MPIPQQLPIFLPKDADYSKQSYEVPGTKRPGQTGHYRTTAFPFLTLDSPCTFQNLVEVFDSGRQRVSGDTPLLGHRPVLSKEPLQLADHYVWQSWDAVDTRRQRLGSGLDKLFRDGVICGAGGHKTVGIWSGNCPTWQLVDLTLQAYEFVTVSLYDTLGKDTSEFIINHTEMTIIFVAPQHMTSILTLAPKTPTIKVVVSLEPLAPEERKIYEKWGQQLGIKIMDIPELEALGQTSLKKPIYPSPDAIATICYTSGTTGNPKGVVLTHGMIANAVHAQNYATNTNDRPVIYCFLPLAHIYGRMVELGMIARGGSLGYWSGDPTRLLEDMQILKPNLFPAVPRVLNRIFQAGMAAGDLPGLKGALFKRALAAKQERFRATGDYTHPIWDRLVFKKLRAVTGGNIQFISSGSAPMSAAGVDFLKIAFSTEVIEGFGCTENVGTATKAWWGDATSAGTIGAPQVNTEIKLVDVPSMGYTSEDKPFPRGEICLRGDHCFREYYKDPENTKAAIDEEGWQHTGDVGTIDACGRFKIIDRVKNIMKLAQGEYVALERVESLYSACPLLAQLYVHGDSLQSYLIAVAIPDPVQLAGLASKVWKKPVSEKDTAALDRAVQDPRIIEAFQAALNKQAKVAGLQGFETIRRIHLTNEQLTVENGCLTPTLKLKRKDVQKKFQKELDALYALGEPGGSKPVKL